MRPFVPCPVAVALMMVPLVPAKTLAADPDPWFAVDKARHFSAASLLAGGAYTVAAGCDASGEARLWAGGLTAMGAGAAKELWDLRGHGDPSWRDLAWDGVGTAAGLVTAWWVDRWWQRRQGGRPDVDVARRRSALTPVAAGPAR